MLEVRFYLGAGRDFRYATTASASCLFIRYCGIGGRGGCPLGASPVISSPTAFLSSQPGRPAMFTDRSAQLGMGTSGPKNNLVPCSPWSITGSPFSFIGVWQSPQLARPFTRYSPRAICFVFLSDARELWYVAPTPNAAMTANAVTRSFILISSSPFISECIKNQLSPLQFPAAATLAVSCKVRGT